MWPWRVVWGIVALAGVAGSWVCFNAARLARHVRRDAVDLLSSARPAHPLRLSRLSELPEPVRRYLEKALSNPPSSARTLRFRHGGRFRSQLDGAWQEIRGEQYYTLDPPAFLWWGKLRSGPGVWVDALDRGVGGKGRMTVMLESTLTLFDRSGPELDQGAMLRLLSDFVLMPELFLDERHVSWQALDEQRATCTFRAPGTGVSVSGTFAFGPDGLPRSFSAERYMDSGRGTPRLLPWSGDYEDYRMSGGRLVPHHFVGYWQLDGQRIAYVDFSLDPPEYDALVSF